MGRWSIMAFNNEDLCTSLKEFAKLCKGLSGYRGQTRYEEERGLLPLSQLAEAYVACRALTRDIRKCIGLREWYDADGAKLDIEECIGSLRESRKVKEDLGMTEEERLELYTDISDIIWAPDAAWIAGVDYAEVKEKLGENHEAQVQD